MTKDAVKARLFAVLVGVFLTGALLWLIFRFGPHASLLPKCLFYTWTGHHCPGCGMTRAVDATMHGRLVEAFWYNPLLMILLPLAMIGIGFEIVGWVRGRPMPVRFRVGRKLAWALLASLLIFWGLRNIPAWPFELLAPH